MKLHPYFLLLLIYFALKSTASGLDFILRKRSLFYVFPGCSFKESPNFATSRKKNTVEKQTKSLHGEFCCIFPCYGKLMRKTMNFACGKVYHWMGI